MIKKNMNKKALTVGFACFLCIGVVMYFNVLMDMMAVIYVLLSALAWGSLVPRKKDTLSKELTFLALGLGIIGCLLWLLFLFPVPQRPSFLLLLLGAPVIIRRGQVRKIAADVCLRVKTLYGKEAFLLLIVTGFLALYFMYASQPIKGWDTLAKHLPLAVKLAQSSISDLSVIEGVYFGDSSLLANVFYAMFYSFGGTIKAMVLFNTIISFLVLGQLLAIARRFGRANSLSVLVALAYLSIPMVFAISTQLVTDIVPIFFLFACTDFLMETDRFLFLQRLPLSGMTAGFAFLAKQTAANFLFPLALFAIARLIFIAFKKKFSGTYIFKTSLFAACAVIGVTAPPIAEAWARTGSPFFPFYNNIFKSSYYSFVAFQDPFVFNHRVLGFDPQSVLNIVFKTHRNTEHSNGALGYTLLLLPFLIPGVIFAILKKHSLFISISFLCLASYAVGTLTTYNIRYFLPALLLLIPCLIHAVIEISGMISWRSLRLAIPIIVAVSLTAPCAVYFVLNIARPHHIHYNPKTIANDNADVLAMVNTPDAKILSANDVGRGDFKGLFISLTWYNTFLLTHVGEGDVSPLDFIRSFDYYLIEKPLPDDDFVICVLPNGKVLTFSIFSPLNKGITQYLSVFAESSSHILYSVKKPDPVVRILLAQDYISDPAVTMDEPQTYKFAVQDQYYQLDLEIKAEKPDKTARCKINWNDGSGRLIDTTILRFKPGLVKTHVQFTCLKPPSKNVKYCTLFLTSRDSTPIKIYSFKLFGISTPPSFLDEQLDDYNRNKYRHFSLPKIRLALSGTGSGLLWHSTQ